MMEEEIKKKIWFKLFAQFKIGFLIFIVSLIVCIFESSVSDFPVISLFGFIYGLIFMIFPCIGMVKFKKYLDDSEIE